MGGGFSGDGAPASAAALSNPYSLAVDPVTRDLFFTDRGNRAVRAVWRGTGKISTIAGGVGTSAPFTSDFLNQPAQASLFRKLYSGGISAREYAFSSPTGIAVSPVDGGVYVTDAPLGIVLRVNVSSGESARDSILSNSTNGFTHSLTYTFARVLFCVDPTPLLLQEHWLCLLACPGRARRRRQLRTSATRIEATMGPQIPSHTTPFAPSPYRNLEVPRT